MVNEINLPPLPEPKFIKKGEIPSISLIEHEHLMTEYGQQCAIAAIEPYAKRIAELKAERKFHHEVGKNAKQRFDSVMKGHEESEPIKLPPH